jgi:hypothetical protein
MELKLNASPNTETHKPTGSRCPVRTAGMCDGHPNRPIVYRIRQSPLPVGSGGCTVTGKFVAGHSTPSRHQTGNPRPKRETGIGKALGTAGQLRPCTHLSYLASENAFDEEKARNDAFRQLEPSWERWLKLDPLFAGCLPSKPLALIGARQMAQKTTQCTSVPIETEPSKYDLVLLALLIKD